VRVSVSRRLQGCTRYENYTAHKEAPLTMTLKTERDGCRFAVAKTDEGKPVIQLELFHDTVSHLRSLTVGFEGSAA
jgi:hypothetical protein